MIVFHHLSVSFELLGSVKKPFSNSTEVAVGDRDGLTVVGRLLSHPDVNASR